MSRAAKFKVVGKLDESVARPGTITIDRASGLFAVRPKGRRREYVLPLGAVADMVVVRVIKAELAEVRRVKSKSRL